MRHCVAAILPALVLCACAGCGSSRRVDSVWAGAEALRDRSLLSFSSALMLKPDFADADQPAFALAPLFIVEVAEGSRPRLDEDQPVVYFAQREIVLDGVNRRQVFYSWSRFGVGGEAPPDWRVLRMTLDSSGFVVVWEVLSSRGDRVAVFVARSLEEAAIARFGGPLPGRRFAIERDDCDADAVVVRVIDDGPLPMGPFVYLDASRGDVATVICRCMAAQVEDISETGYYTLVHWPGAMSVADMESEMEPSASTSSDSAFDRYQYWDDPDWLGRVLRLPQGF